MNEQKQRPIRDSLAELKSTRNMTACAMLLAVQILLGFVGTINIGNAIRITFTYLAVATTAYLFGPIPAMINTALSDIIMYLLRPTGAFHPGFTLTAALAGLVYGLFFYRRRITARRVVLAKLIVDIITLLLNTLWLHQLYGNAYVALLLPRAIRAMLQLPLDVLLLMALFSSLARVFKSLGKPMPEAIQRVPRRGRRTLAVLSTLLWVLMALWLNNTSLLVDTHGETNKWLAHRGVAQTFDIKAVQWDTDTSKIIYPPEHEYLENTIPSMRKAFELGADCVELDLHLTKDSQLAVFHDYTVEYRTGAPGNVSDYTMAELKQLDVGYGYTADGGKTYPFRSKGIGLMPEFKEVLSTFAGKDLLIHLKDDGVAAAAALWADIITLDPAQMAHLAFYGDNNAMDYLRGQSDELRVMSMSTLKDALIRYELLGWSGYVPDSMKHTELHIPAAYARFIWGWPAKFMQRMDAVETRVVLVNGDGGWSEGFDDAEARKQIPENYTGYVWTNRIDRIGGAK